MSVEDWMMLYEPFSRGLLFVLGLLLLAGLEHYFPYRLSYGEKSKRWLNHIFLITFSTGLARTIFHMIPVVFAVMVAKQGVGVFHSVDAPYWAAVLLSILGLDFFMYLEHRVMHRFPILFRIHRLHHIDHELDVTTGIRFHPVEILIFMAFKFIGIMFLGAPVMAVFIFEVMFSFFTPFMHANIRLPIRFEKILGIVFVTPRMHRIHHSDIPYEHNANFGFCFSFWDKFLKTYRYRVAGSENTLLFGLEGYFAPKFKTLTAMLLLPLNLSSLKAQVVKPLPKRRAGDVPSKHKGKE